MNHAQRLNEEVVKRGIRMREDYANDVQGFRCDIYLEKPPAPVQYFSGLGSTKKAAKNNACESALGGIDNFARSSTGSQVNSPAGVTSAELSNASLQLNNLCQKECFSISEEYVGSGPDNAPEFTCTITIKHKDRVGKIKGVGTTKKLAKNKAAQAAIQFHETNSLFANTTDPENDADAGHTRVNATTTTQTTTPTRLPLPLPSLPPTPTPTPTRPAPPPTAISPTAPTPTAATPTTPTTPTTTTPTPTAQNIVDFLGDRLNEISVSIFFAAGDRNIVKHSISGKGKTINEAMNEINVKFAEFSLMSNEEQEFYALTSQRGLTYNINIMPAQYGDKHVRASITLIDNITDAKFPNIIGIHATEKEAIREAFLEGAEKLLNGAFTASSIISG